MNEKEEILEKIEELINNRQCGIFVMKNGSTLKAYPIHKRTIKDECYIFLHDEANLRHGNCPLSYIDDVQKVHIKPFFI